MANLEPFRGPDARARLVEQYDTVLSGWPVAFEERDVETSLGTTHIVVTGHESAAPLVLLHGAATTAAWWSPIIAPLSNCYRCYCIDTITDANKSVATKRVRDVADYIVWLRDVFSALGIDNARVAGISYGGWLAALLALHAPQLVNRLVLMCPAGTFTRLTREFMVRVLTSSLLRSRFLVGRTIQWMSTTPDAISDPVLALVATNLLTCRALRQEMMAPTAFTDDELRRISAPTTVVIGDRDILYRGGPRPAIARAQTLIPNVHTRLIEGAGHVLTFDAPDSVLAELTTALA